jgi:acyl-CoA thioester hydrolase
MKRVTSAVVHPWTCDIMGHLNTRYYAALFDDANYIVLRELESRAGEESVLLGWADAKNEIEYLNEIKAGSIVHLDSGIRRIGTKSLTVVTEMHTKERVHVCARMCAIIARFNLAERRAIPLSQDIKVAAASWLEDGP